MYTLCSRGLLRLSWCCAAVAAIATAATYAFIWFTAWQICCCQIVRPFHSIGAWPGFSSHYFRYIRWCCMEINWILFGDFRNAENWMEIIWMTWFGGSHFIIWLENEIHGGEDGDGVLINVEMILFNDNENLNYYFVVMYVFAKLFMLMEIQLFVRWLQLNLLKLFLGLVSIKISRKLILGKLWIICEWLRLVRRVSDWSKYLW